MSASLLSMGAVDFGIIVDGAVILVEHLFHRVHGEDLPDARPPDHEAGRLSQRILKAAREVARPTLFSLLIIIAAYLPIFSLQRVEGRIFRPIANTVVSALLGALLVSFTLVPVLAHMSLRRSRPVPDSPLLSWARRAYDPAIRFSMLRPEIVLTLAAGAFLSALTLLPRLGSEFLPELNEGALYVTLTLPGNMSLTAGRKLVPLLKERLRRTPEVTELLSQLGRPEDGTDPTLSNNLEIFVKLKPMSAWRSSMRSLNDLVTEMDRNIREVPGTECNFSQPIRDNVNENISGQVGQIAVKIYGDDLDVLQDAAQKAEAAIGGVAGVADLGVVKSGEKPPIAVTLDRPGPAPYDPHPPGAQGYGETAMGGHGGAELWVGRK